MTETKPVQERPMQVSIGTSAWIGMVVIYGMASRALGEAALPLSTVERLAIPLIPVGILFGSILIHELAHAVVMQANAVRVEKIALEFWGGYAQPAKEGPTLLQLPAGKVFAISVAGPLSNLILAVGIWVFALDASSLAELRGPVGSFTEYSIRLAFYMNLVLALFNMLPLIPLDGGHVFRSVLMGISGGIVVGTIAAGLFSLVVGSAYVRYYVDVALQGGWTAIQPHLFLMLFSGFVVFASLMVMLGVVAERQAPESRAVHPLKRVTAVLVFGLPIAMVYALHIEGGWAQLPLTSGISDLIVG